MHLWSLHDHAVTFTHPFLGYQGKAIKLYYCHSLIHLQLMLQYLVWLSQQVFSFSHQLLHHLDYVFLETSLLSLHLLLLLLQFLFQQLLFLLSCLLPGPLFCPRKVLEREKIGKDWPPPSWAQRPNQIKERGRKSLKSSPKTPCPHHREHTSECERKGSACLASNHSSLCCFQMQQGCSTERKEAPVLGRFCSHTCQRALQEHTHPTVSPALPCTCYGLLPISEGFICLQDFSSAIWDCRNLWRNSFAWGTKEEHRN